MLQRFIMTLGGCLVGLSVMAESTAVFPPTAVREDFRQLYDTLRSAHFDLYVETPKPAYDAAFQTALEQIDRPMTQAEIITLFQHFVAAGRVAHARVEGTEAAFAGHVEAGGAMIPLYVRVRGDRAWVSDDYSGREDIAPGDEVLQINNEPVAVVLQRMRRALSADTDHLANTLVELQFPRLVWQTLGTPDQYTLVLSRNGAEHTSAVVPLTREQIRTHAAALDDPGLELSWTEREARVLPGNVAYLRPGPFYNVDGEGLWDTSGFQTFIDAAFRQFMEAGADRLLIDLRNNPGGDASFSDLMVAWIADRPFRFYADFQVKVSQAAEASNAARLEGENPHWVSQAYAKEFAAREPGEVFAFDMSTVEPRAGERYRGHVYALVNRHSYSNTVTVAAILQDYGFATILGEETADLATTLGAMEHFELTNTGIRVGFPKARITRPSGDPNRRGVVPDVPIETPIVETADDPVLQAALAEARSGG